jgi:hypothetical protein
MRNNKTHRQIEIIWSIKSNSKCTLQSQDPVLNEAAARLGVSLRQTEDQLTRDMLVATAAFINCVGGNNGRFVAVLKSLIIDLEPEVAF